MFSNKKCRVCDSQYTVYLQDVYGQRTKSMHKQYYCMDCHSFFHESNYHENEDQLKYDFEALLSHKDSSSANQSQLVLELITLLPGVKNVCEIGHGAGFFLKACHDFGLQAVGYDINKHCHDYAINTLNVNSFCRYFDKNDGKYDLIVANQVFEHLERPRDLFETLKNALNPDGAIYIAVPKLNREKWKFLSSAGNFGEKHPSDIFMDNDVHITFFSSKGLKLMGRQFGCRDVHEFNSTDVFHKSPHCYEGIIYYF